MINILFLRPFTTPLISGFGNARTLLQNHRLFPKVDWERIEAGQYAVVDPVNPAVILYLSEQDYIVMVRVAITSNKTLKVLAGPGDTQPDAASTSSSQNSQNSPPPGRSVSPSPWSEVLNLDAFKQSSKGRRGRVRLLNVFNTRLREFIGKRKVSNTTQAGARGISMVELNPSNVVKWFTSWHSIVSWWSRGSLMSTVHGVEANSFGLWLKRILVSNGINNLISRLKIMLFVVNAYLGGRKLTTTEPLGMRIKLTNGLPAALPLYVRDGIRSGSRHMVHIWTSMLFSYKGILGSWSEPNLQNSSITQPMPTPEDSELQSLKDFSKLFWYVLSTIGIRRPNLKIRNYFFSTHAGPNSSITLLGAGLDAYLWFAFDKFRNTDHNLLAQRDLKWLRLLQSMTGVKGNYIREWLELTDQKDILLKIRKTAKAFALTQQLASSVVENNQRSLLSMIITRFIPENKYNFWFEDITPRNLMRILRRNGVNISIQSTLKEWLKRYREMKRTAMRTADEAVIPMRPVSNEAMVKYDYIYDFLGMNLKMIKWSRPTLQRLHNLYEAAGKVRTIAIVDYWTNFVLKPLHDWMFSVLEQLPQDATFDQEGRVREFATRGYTEVWSYDLKSATDLIPLYIYKAVFAPILPEPVMELWLRILTDRDFRIPGTTRKAFKNHPPTVRYTTGQPMGALTSWAALALAHHALVLCAALLAGVTTPSTVLSFRDYMVLGDDVVIANRAVADAYRNLLIRLHIPLSLAKSHISEIGFFNFANQSILPHANISPVSLREEINATSMAERIELVTRLLRRGWKDINSRLWVPMITRLLLPLKVWSALTADIQRGRVPLIVRWILAVMLIPGTSRYGWAGYSNIALETFLGAQLRKGDLFSLSMSEFGDLIDRNRSGRLLIGILAKWVNRVYKGFLDSRTLLLSYPQWIRKVVSVDLEWLFDGIFQTGVQEALDRWSSKYRRPLKAIQVTASLPNFDQNDVALGTGIPWNELVSLVSEADAALPIVPDFQQSSLEILTTLEVGSTPGGARPEELAVKRDRQARESLLRVSNLLGMIDHLGPTGTPGFEEAWDIQIPINLEPFTKRTF